VPKIRLPVMRMCDMKMFRFIPAASALALGFAVTLAAQPQPRTIFKGRAQLSDAEIETVSQGHAVTRVLSSTDKYGVLVAGAVYIDAPIDKFLASFRDVKRLRENKVYLDVQEFSQEGAPPKPSDFERLAFDKKDLDDLHACKAGDCDLQVFDDVGTKSLDWNAPNRYDLANAAFRLRALEGMTAYLSGGLKALGNYRDRKNPFNVYQQTKDMVDSSFYLPEDTSKGIYRHVIDYPAGKLPGADDFFYWEKIDFGQGPTIRVNHVSVFPQGFGAAKAIIAVKQLYASRYIRVALQMFYCVPDTEHPGKPGFFLIEVNDSRLPDFSGPKLSVVRKIATEKGVDSTKDTLTMFAKRLNGRP